MSEWRHHYISTACIHAIGDGRPEMHAACRNTCKYAASGKPEYCRCPCHGEVGTQPGWGSSVDTARTVARYLLGVIQANDIQLPAEMLHRIETDPALFWLRGEEKEPGTWRDLG